MTPALNKALPEFEAFATGGVKFTPAAFIGRTVVLYFYPKDNTPGCTTEAMQFRDHHKEFTKAGAVCRATTWPRTTSSSRVWSCLSS
jgi:thioredoxin-dependent peroxiredoxin